jgi:hypothetical protein
VSHRDHTYDGVQLGFPCTLCLREQVDALTARVAALEAAAKRCSREGCGALVDPQTNPEFSRLRAAVGMPAMPRWLCTERLDEWLREAP